MDQLIKLGIDKTTFYQFAIFLVTFLVLKYVLFNKLLAVINHRENQTTKLEDNANQNLFAADKLEEQFKSGMQKIMSDAQLEFSNKRGEIVNQETSKIDKVENELNIEANQKREENSKEIEIFRKEVLANTNSLAENLVSKLT